MTTDPLTERINDLNAEFDKRMVNGRQVPRRLIIEFAYRHGWQDGRDSMAREDNENMQALMARKVADGR